MHLHKRALSSPALRQSLKNRKGRLIDRIHNVETDEQTSINLEQAKATALDEDLGDDETDEEASYRADRNVFGSLEANKVEIAELDKLIELADKVTAAKDSKLRKLTGPSGILSQAIAGHFWKKQRSSYSLATRIPWITWRGRSPSACQSRKRDIKIITVYGNLNEAQRKERLADFPAFAQGHPDSYRLH